MSTTATIALKLPKRNKVLAIRVQYDGYPEHVGLILHDTFNTQEKLEELLALGQLKILGRKLQPEPGKQHDFQVFQDDVCLIEDDEDFGGPALELDLKNGEFEAFSEEHNYLFKGGRWYRDDLSLSRIVKAINRGEDWFDLYEDVERYVSPVAPEQYELCGEAYRLLRDKYVQAFRWNGTNLYCPYHDFDENNQAVVRAKIVHPTNPKLGYVGTYTIPAREFIEIHRSGQLEIIPDYASQSRVGWRDKKGRYHDHGPCCPADGEGDAFQVAGCDEESQMPCCGCGKNLGELPVDELPESNRFFSC